MGFYSGINDSGAHGILFNLRMLSQSLLKMPIWKLAFPTRELTVSYIIPWTIKQSDCWKLQTCCAECIIKTLNWWNFVLNQFYKYFCYDFSAGIFTIDFNGELVLWSAVYVSAYSKGQKDFREKSQRCWSGNDMIITGPQKGNTWITVACKSPFVLCICNRTRPSSVFSKLNVDCKE